jgi:hypothetical protein
VDEVVRAHQAELSSRPDTALAAMGRDLLVRLYPEARAIFERT